MSDFEKLQNMLEDQGRAFEGFKDAHKQQLADIEKDGKAAAESIAKMQAAFEDVAAIREDVAKLEAQIKLPARRDAAEMSKEEREHVDAFENYLRHPKDSEALTRYQEAGKAYCRSMGITLTGSSGVIPTDVSSRILSRVRELSPIRQVANVQTVSNENMKFPITGDDGAGGWAAAGGSRSASATPTLVGRTLTYGTAYAYPSVEEEALNDVEWDVLSWLEDQVAEILAVQEGAAFVDGDGSAKPTGFLQNVASTSDSASPARAEGTLQYIITGVAGGFANDMTGSPPGNPAAPLFSLVYGLKAKYRQNARFVLARATLSTVMQFRDANGNYLFRPRATAGVEDMLMGFPLLEAEDMPAVGSNSLSIAFGDFNRGYQIGDIVRSLRITTDDNITAPGFVKFYARKRVGGKVLDDDAIKVLKFGTS